MNSSVCEYRLSVNSSVCESIRASSVGDLSLKQKQTQHSKDEPARTDKLDKQNVPSPCLQEVGDFFMQSCCIFSSEDELTCQTSSWNSPVGASGVNVSVVFSYPGTNKADENTGRHFTYQPNPEVQHIQPNTTILRFVCQLALLELSTNKSYNTTVISSTSCCVCFLENPRVVFLCSGGVLITATGQNMNSVEEPIMVVTVLYRGSTAIYYQVRTEQTQAKLSPQTKQ